jgi:hypothetical protein
MKGISHFCVGVAVASCFPAAVEAGLHGDPLYFVLGGVCGLLPDTLDFRFARFLCRVDIRVRPDPLHPDAEMIARACALAVNRAHAEQKPVAILLETIPLGPGTWQSYDVRFDPARRQVVVEYGGIVRGGQAQPGAASGCTGSAPLECGLKTDYLATTNVSILDGPLFVMEPLRDGRVAPQFIPWHRQWSHSLLAALVAGGLAWLFRDAAAGAVAALALAAHALFDQTGFMGSNLLFPFRHGRTEGLKLCHAIESWPNLSTVWVALALVYWNLLRASPAAYAPPALRYWLYAAIVPLGTLFMLRRWLRRQAAAKVSPQSPGGAQR